MPNTRHPGQHAGLTRDAVLAAARGIADQAGIEALTMRRLAQTLGVMPNALYTYFPGKNDLDALLDSLLGEIINLLELDTAVRHDLPIPREPATLTLVPANIDGFATQWEIPTDEMRLWVLSHELAGHTLFGAVHLRDEDALICLDLAK
jgi:AcrR family transcriptional regulator